MELADIFNQCGEAYCDKFGALMLPSHRKAMRDICECRTPARGGEVYLCRDCWEFKYSYHSCKNRHCPKCGNDQAQVWLLNQMDKLLPVTHFLVTFTLPEKLRKLARSNQRVVYRILMTSAAQALQQLAWNPKWIGGLLGVVSVLQTWTRDLRYHPHVHMIVTGGGLAKESQHWMPAGKAYLVPGPALSLVFRAKFRDALIREGLFDQAPADVWKQEWIIDILPVASGRAAFLYLAPYIFRVALSNRRLVSLVDGKVTFCYKDSSTGKSKTLTLPAQQFIHRFLQHVLPSRFRKVRYYGLFSPHQKERLSAARKILHVSDNPTGTTPQSEHHSAAPPHLPLCPHCKKPMVLLEKLLPQRIQPAAIRSP